MGEITDPNACRRIVEKRVSESPLADKKYFHRVAPGSKRSYGHQEASDRSVTPPSGNYGIHAAADDTLVLIDIDDHKDGYDEEALAYARENLPETLTFSSAHGGEGRLYHVPEDGDGLLPAARLDEEFGKENISAATWGETRVSNQYIVAAGSQLDAKGCTKDGCEECPKPDGGRYTILHDSEIATLNADLLVKVLAADPDVTKVSEANESSQEDGEESSTYEPEGDSEAYDALEALDCEQVAGLTIVDEWNDDHNSGNNVRAFYPTWDPACNGAANVVGRDGWNDTAGKGKGGPVVMAAIACDELPDCDEKTAPSDVSGPDWVTAYKHLQELGFDLPSLSSRPEPKGGLSWATVRWLFEEETASRGRAAAQALLRDKYHFMTTDVKDELYVYNQEEGIFTPELGDVRGEIYEGLTAEHWSTHNVREILAGLKQKNRVRPREFNGREAFDDPHVCVENGVLNLFTRELLDHSSEYKFVDRIPVTYDPDADASRFEEFMENLTEREEDAKAMLEMVGHALVPDAHERGWKKFLILHGGSDNGKSFFYALVKQLLDGADNVGEGNVSSVKLAKLASNRFSKKAMYGHMANIAGEIDGKKIRNTADLKDITGGDSMEIEPKGGESFSDTMNTTLMFAANDPPIIGNRDRRAIGTRIVPVKLPFTFTEDPSGPMEKQKVPERVLEEELATPEAMSALLSLALDGIERLRENHGDVSLPEPPMERLEMYEGEADPMKKFGQTCLTAHASDYIVKADVTRIYEVWAEENGHETGTNVHSALHGALEYQDAQPRNPDYSGTSLPLRPWDERQRVLSRVTLTDEGLHYAKEAGLVVEEQEEEEGPLGLADLDTGRYDEITAEFGGQMEPRPWLTEEGWLLDDEFDLDYVVREGRGQGNPMSGISEGDTIRITNARVKTDDDGLRYVEITPRCEVEIVEESETGPDPDAHRSDAQAAADGGKELEEETGGQETEVDEESAEDADTGEEFDDWRVDLANAYRATTDGDGADKGKLKVALTDRGREFKSANEIVEDVAREKGFLTVEGDRVRATDELKKML